MSKRILLVDAHNMFFRAYVVDPSISTNGIPIGGVKGFLKIIQKTLRDIEAERVVIVWDGPGGSVKRRKINENYKAGRKIPRTNRHSQDFTDQQKRENMSWQMGKIMEYLNHLPLVQVMAPGVEADDIISYFSSSPSLSDWKKIIYSNDKDYIQLCGDDVTLYRPIVNKFHTVDNIIEDFGIHPNNFALARALVGDSSDNLPGIKGVGMKTVKKCFDFLCEPKSYSVMDIEKHCKEVDSKRRAYENILLDIDLVHENYKMMQLYNPLISYRDKKMSEYAIKNAAYEFDFTALLVQMSKDGFGDYNWETLKQKMRYIVKSNRVKTS